MPQVLLLVFVALMGTIVGINIDDFRSEKQAPPVEMKVESMDLESASTSESEADGSHQGEFYAIEKIIDGDTITVSINGARETIRLIGIDAPEMGDGRTTVECFGSEAKSHLTEILGERIRIEKDATQGERDRYGRLLAYLFDEGGTNLNQRMIEDGFVHEYTYRSAYRYQTEFKNAEKQARERGSGLWTKNACPKTAERKALAPPITQNASAGASIVPNIVSAPTPAAPEVTPPAASAVQETPRETPAAPPMTPTSPPPPGPAPAPIETSSTGNNYTCSSNTYNCSDFSTHAEAQAVYEQCGGASNDIHKLDNNKDGEACESLP